jgi:peptide methionine sulfoxide reductase MsrA
MTRQGFQQGNDVGTQYRSGSIPAVVKSRRAELTGVIPATVDGEQLRDYATEILVAPSSTT